MLQLFFLRLIFLQIKAAEAIHNIPYGGQGGYTATGGAAKCVCDQLLDSSCSVEFADNTCVDVVFVTDGSQMIITYVTK